MLADRPEDLGTRQRPGQQRIDEGPIFIRQLGERQPDLVGNGAAGGDRAGKYELVERVRIPERSHSHRGGGADHDHAVVARYRRARQYQLVGERSNLVGSDLTPRFPMLTIAVQRDGAAYWQKWPEALVTALDPQLLIEQAPPDHDSLTGKLGVNFVGNAGDGQTTVDADQAPFRLPREGAEPLPCAHLAEAIGRQVRQPVVDPRVGLGSMIAAIVGNDEPRQPEVRLRLGLGLMKMIERLVGFLDGPERPLDLALGARRRPPDGIARVPSSAM
jgi:hypothetical protein